MTVPFYRRPFRNRYCYNVVLLLIAVNCAIHFLLKFASLPQLSFYLSLNPVCFIHYRMFWQPFTYMFIHADFWHLFFNMLALFFFGVNVERRLGSKEFLLLYLSCGIFSGLVSLLIYFVTGAHYAVLLGASGAIYAVLLAFAVIFPTAKIYVWYVLPVPAPLLILIYALFELWGIIKGNTGVAHLTHLAGFVGAWLYFLIRMGINPVRVWQNTYR